MSELLVYRTQEELLQANKDVLLVHAEKKVEEFKLSVIHSCEKIESYVDIFLREFIAQKFLLFWWERRKLYRKMFHIRFFQFQITALHDGRLVLSIQEYGMATGDYFSNEIYRATLPNICSISPQGLRTFQYELAQQRELLLNPIVN